MADGNAGTVPSRTNIEWARVIAAESTDHDRLVELKLKGKAASRLTLCMDPSLSVADFDAAVHKLGSTKDPLGDLLHCVNSTGQLLDVYRAVEQLPPYMKDDLTVIADYLEYARKLIRLAASVPFPDLLSDEILLDLELGCVALAKDSFVKAAIRLDSFIQRLAARNQFVNRVPRDVVPLPIARGIFVFQLWALIFEKHLFV